MEQASIDLGELMKEREVIRRRFGPITARLKELESIISIQEKLALGKLRGEEVFEQLTQLDIRVEQHD